MLTCDCRNNNNSLFCLLDDLEIQVEGEGGSSTADYGGEIVLPKLDRIFGDVPAVIIRWCKLVSHAGGTYYLFIFF